MSELQPMTTPQKKLSQAILLSVLVLLLLGAGFFVLNTLGQSVVAPEPTPQREGITALEPLEAVTDFTLTNQHGDNVTRADLQGKLTLLFFGFTHCPDFCPTTLDSFKRIRLALADSADQVNFVFVSVDGSRDTPDAMRAYFEVRGVADFVTGLTGTEDAVQAMGGDYGLFFERNPGTTSLENYLVDHSTPSYLLDREGRLRVIYSYGTTPDDIAAHLSLYL